MRVWYEIPNFKRYLVNRKGEVKNIITNILLTGCTNPFGYFSYGLTDDSGHKTTMGRHRLLGIVFLDKPKGFILEKFEVNHLNCVPGDDWLGNLEWVTAQENCEWAGINGSPKCLPIDMYDTKTGKVTSFPSIISCAKEISLSKDQVALRVKSDGQCVYPDGLQFKLTSSKSSWSNVMKFGSNKHIVLKHLVSGELIYLSNHLSAAKLLGVVSSVITRYVRDQLLHKSLYQVKVNNDDIPWRKLGDIKLELEKSSGRKGVVSYTSGKPVYYSSGVECSNAEGISVTNLSNKLSNPPKDKSCIKYKYYSETLQGSPNEE